MADSEIDAALKTFTAASQHVVAVLAKHRDLIHDGYAKLEQERARAADSIKAELAAQRESTRTETEALATERKGLEMQFLCRCHLTRNIPNLQRCKRSVRRWRTHSPSRSRRSSLTSAAIGSPPHWPPSRLFLDRTLPPCSAATTSALHYHVIQSLTRHCRMHMDEEDGSVFIDRDGRFFHLILNFLRAPAEFEVPTDAVTVRELIREAEFYKLVSAP